MNDVERLNLMKTEQNEEELTMFDPRDAQLSQAVPFKDRFEHLQDLEYEAKILLEMGLRRCPEESSMPDEDHDESKFYGDLFALRKMPLSELEELLKNVQSRNRRREILSLNSGKKLPFLEIIQNYKLDDFERKVVLLLFMKNTAHEFRGMFPDSPRGFLSRIHSGGISVGRILSTICRDFGEQLEARRYFSAKSNLIKNEIIVGGMDSFDECSCILDEEFFLHQRIANFIIGDNNVYSHDMTFINVEESKVCFDQVIVSPEHKKAVIEAADNFFMSEKRSREMNINGFYGYGTGLVMLFHGPSGTGKTMMAHAVAKKYGKKMYQLNVAKANKSSASMDDVIKYIFKEARLSGGMVFFDECDDLFNQDSYESRVLLMEIEKSECLTIMTTNRIYRLDPALDRRITLKVPFRLPDVGERQKIWQALIHPGFKLSEDVYFPSLAEKYVFTGGLIKNTLMMVQNEALGRSGNSDEPVIRMKDLLKAADYQAEHLFQNVHFLSYVKPKAQISDLPIATKDKDKLIKLSEVIADMHRQRMPLLINIVLHDLDLGKKCVEGICSQMGIHLRCFGAEDVIIENSRENFIDPFTQNQISPMTYFFQDNPGHCCFDLLLDRTGYFDKKKEENDKGTAILMPFLEKVYLSQRIIFLVTRNVFLQGKIGGPDVVLKIGFPGRTQQLDHWKLFLKQEDDGEEGRLESLVSRYPMHLCGIEECVKKATILQSISRKNEEDIFFFIEQVQSGYCGGNHLLFGNLKPPGTVA